MANDFSRNPWIIDTPEVEGTQPTGEPRADKPAKSVDPIRVRRVTYVGEVGDEVEIRDASGRVVWEGIQRTVEPLVDDVNLPGGRLTWEGFQVVKMGAGNKGKLYISYL